MSYGLLILKLRTCFDCIGTIHRARIAFVLSILHTLKKVLTYDPASQTASAPTSIGRDIVEQDANNDVNVNPIPIFRTTELC